MSNSHTYSIITRKQSMNLSHCHTTQLNLKHSKSHCTLNPSALTETNSAPKSLTTADHENGKKMKMKILHTAAKPGGKPLTHAAHERHQQSAAPAVSLHQTERPQPRCLQQSAVHVCQTGYRRRVFESASPRGSSYSLAYPQYSFTAV